MDERRAALSVYEPLSGLAWVARRLDWGLPPEEQREVPGTERQLHLAALRGALIQQPGPGLVAPAPKAPVRVNRAGQAFCPLSRVITTEPYQNPQGSPPPPVISPHLRNSPFSSLRGRHHFSAAARYVCDGTTSAQRPAERAPASLEPSYPGLGGVGAFRHPAG
jgi:hypothetical protein